MSSGDAVDDADTAFRRRCAASTCNRAKRKAGCSSDRKSTRLNSSHLVISYAVFCLKKKSCNRRCRRIDLARCRSRQNRRSRRCLFLRPLSHSSALRHLAWASDSTTANLDFHIHLSHHGSGPERVGNCFGEGSQRTDKQTSFGEKDRTRLTAQPLNNSTSYER